MLFFSLDQLRWFTHCALGEKQELVRNLERAESDAGGLVNSPGGFSSDLDRIKG